MADLRATKTRIHFGKLVGLMALTGVLHGCLQPVSEDAFPGVSTDGVGGGTTSPVTVDGTLAGDVYFAVDSSWEQDTSNTLTRQGACQIPLGTAVSPAVPVSASCLIRIPEGQLYYSKLKFTYGTTNSTVCKTVRFYPAYYQASSDVAFLKYWENSTPPTAFDCSAANHQFGIPKKDCYFGAAPRLFSGFPLFQYEYISTAQGVLAASKTLESSNSLITGTNLLTTTRMADAATTVTFGDNPNAQFEGGTMHPHRIECRDEHEQLRAFVTVDIADDDTLQAENPGDPSDDYWYDWDEVR